MDGGEWMDLDGGMQKRRGKTHGLLAAETAGCFFFFTSSSSFFGFQAGFVTLDDSVHVATV